jgi:hypothetical protein
MHPNPDSMTARFTVNRILRNLISLFPRADSRKNIEKLLVNADRLKSEYSQQFQKWPISKRPTTTKATQLLTPYPLFYHAPEDLSDPPLEHQLADNLDNQQLIAGKPNRTENKAPTFFAWDAGVPEDPDPRVDSIPDKFPTDNEISPRPPTHLVPPYFLNDIGTENGSNKETEYQSHFKWLTVPPPPRITSATRKNHPLQWGDFASDHTAVNWQSEAQDRYHSPSKRELFETQIDQEIKKVDRFLREAQLMHSVAENDSPSSHSTASSSIPVAGLKTPAHDIVPNFYAWNLQQVQQQQQQPSSKDEETTVIEPSGKG